jgi:outer membrane protein TolC
MKKSIIQVTGILLAFCAVVSNTLAQEAPRVVDLKTAIQYGLENNLTQSIYENNIEMTKQQNLEGLSRYLPQINANASFDYNMKLQTSIIPAGIFGPQQVRIQMGNPFVSSASVQLDQKLYDQSNIAALKARKYNLQLADMKQNKNNEDIIYNISMAYYQVKSLDLQWQLLKENRAQYDTLLRIMQVQLDRGVVRKLDYNRTQVALNNINSQLAVLEANRSIAMNQLKMNMGLPFENPLDIDSTEMAINVKMPEDEVFSSEKRLDDQILNQNLLLQSYDYKMKKWSAAPVLSAYARYGANAYSKKIETAFNQWFDYSAVGLRLNIPIFNGMRAHAQMKQSQLTMKNLEQNIKLTRQSNQLEFENAKTKLYSSYLNFQQDRSNLDLAKEVFDASTLEYKQGQIPLSDFLNADYSYKQAQSNYINSLVNFLSARIDYEKAKGNLTEYASQL